MRSPLAVLQRGLYRKVHRFADPPNPPLSSNPRQDRQRRRGTVASTEDLRALPSQTPSLSSKSSGNRCSRSGLRRTSVATWQIPMPTPARIAPNAPPYGKRRTSPTGNRTRDRGHPNRLLYIGVRHDEAAAFRASRFAKLTGRLGVCAGTTAQMIEIGCGPTANSVSKH